MLSKLMISVLIVSSVVSVLADDASNNEADEAFGNIIKLLCNNMDMDDSVAGNIISNCKFGQFSDTQDWAKYEDDVIMNCTKQTSLTDKERLTAFCDGTVGQCYLDGLGKKFQEIAAVKKPTADEITKGIDAMKTTLECIKQYVPNKDV